MKHKYLISIVTLLFFVLLSFEAISQEKSIESLKKWELKEYAKNAEETFNYAMALKYYQELYSRNTKNSAYKFQTAFFYYKTRDFNSSKKLFNELYEEKGYKYKEALFYTAEINKIQGNYSEAEVKFNEFIDIYNNKNDLRLKFFAIQAVEGIKLTVDSNFKKDVYIIHLNTTINHPHLESSPIIINDSAFVYSSYNIDSIEFVNISAKSCPVSSFYLAKIINNSWTGGLPPPEPYYNIPNYCTANGAFSPDKTRFYFTMKSVNEMGVPISNLYVTEKINADWSEPFKIENKVNIPFYNSTQPSVGKTYDPNLEVIYFVSDRPNGWGGKDIWFSVYNKIHKTYSEPINAGGYINTVGDEMTPFYDNINKIMYFSSNGLPSFGGFDVFKSIGDITNWTPAQNIGSPINSSFDDFYYSKFSNQEKGFFISNRPEALDWGSENCCFDIFMFDINEPEKINITGQLEVPLVSLNHEIDSIFETNQFDEKQQFDKYISNAIVNLNIKNNLDSTYFTLFTDTTDNKGVFSFNVERGNDYQININATGYLFSSCEFSTKNQIDSLNLENIRVEPEVEQNIILQNILFEFNSAELTQDSKNYIDSVIVPVLEKYDDIIVEIGAHTDYKGTFEYNMELSQQRAQSVVNHIVAAGISEKRIIAKGYGETKHLVPERFSNGDDNPEARKLNRRVEFKIIGFVN
ncbi:MAG: OmpA family protein [Bacteroidales bacterium]|nr:OmpA family protein [Bacteroidales bacterium]